MSYKKFVIPLQPRSKPRGEIGKQGNITHSSGGYRGWQADFLKQLRKLAGRPHTYVRLAGIIVLHSRAKRRGLPDVSNMLGAVEDTLIEAKWLKDDNFKIVPRVFSDCIERNYDAIEIYIFPIYPNWRADFISIVAEALTND